MGEPRHDDPYLTYEAIAKQIEREDALIGQRLGWALQTNAFLFAALGLLRGGDTWSQVALAAAQVIPVVGLFVSLAGLIGVLAAHGRLKKLKGQTWDDLKDKYPSFLWPQPFGDDQAHAGGWWSSFIPPSILCLAWLWILLVWSEALPCLQPRPPIMIRAASPIEARTPLPTDRTDDH